jgi:peptidyl-prolyl cis-trans isomerase D
LNDLITGKNPDPKVIQTFGNPQTGEIDRAQLGAFIEKVKTQDPQSEMSRQWTSFLLGIRHNRLAQKYNEFVRNSLYVTSLEAREDYNQRNRLASFRYVALDYAAVPDKAVKVSDQDYKDYYQENKYRFKNPQESRTIEYVVFDAIPSKADSAEVKAKVDKLFSEFKVTTNDSLFVGINSDTKLPISYIEKGHLDPKVDTAVFSASKGALIGPIFSNGFYTMVKVLDVKMSPDSVRASHILINPTAEGGLEKAKIKADSIKNVIQIGAESFASLAAKYGTDASKDKGGSLGTFGRGAMIPEFEDAVFNGKPGDLKVITTQFGVHVIKIDNQKGASKVVKVALVDKALVSSSKTQQDYYAKASTFLSNANDASSFDEQSKKMGYTKLVAGNVLPTSASIPGLENPREMVRWAYKASEGDVAKQIFETNNKFIIAKLAAVYKKGTMSLEQVKKQIKLLVLNRVKSKMLLEKMNNALAGASSIDQVAKKLDKPVVPVDNIVFANPILPGIAQENKLVGTVFGSQPNKLSKAIDGDNGVYVFVVNGFSNPSPLSNAFRQKQQMIQGLLQRVTNETYKVLSDRANIKDNRARFF